MTICEICTSGFSRTKSPIFCDGCKKQFHGSCISKQIDILVALNVVPGLSWRCNDCQKSCIVLNQNEITVMLENKLDESLAHLKCKLDSAFNSNIKKNSEVTSYSSVVRGTTDPAILVLPKNTSQAPNQVKSDILSCINPIENNIHPNKVKKTRDGGLIVGCQNKEENKAFLTLARQKLAGSYDIKELGGVNPRIRIAGMSEKHDEENVKNFLIKSNSHIFYDDSHIRIVKLSSHKKNANLYQAVLEVDKTSYSKAIKAGHLIIGYDSCVVFDALSVYRCFKCNEFHHSAIKCKNKLSCPICSEEHELKDCKSEIHKCSNCVKHNQRAHSRVPTDHTVFDELKCTVYKNAKSKLNRDLGITTQ